MDHLAQLPAASSYSQFSYNKLPLTILFVTREHPAHTTIVVEWVTISEHRLLYVFAFLSCMPSCRVCLPANLRPITPEIKHIRPYPLEYTGSRPLSQRQANERQISSQVGDHWRTPAVVCFGASFCFFLFYVASSGAIQGYRYTKHVPSCHFSEFGVRGVLLLVELRFG
ncbi:hypothetical protein GGI35DRAFT_354599 [Trichoderma velutinum]